MKSLVLSLLILVCCDCWGQTNAVSTNRVKRTYVAPLPAGYAQLASIEKQRALVQAEIKKNKADYEKKHALYNLQLQASGNKSIQKSINQNGDDYTRKDAELSRKIAVLDLKEFEIRDRYKIAKPKKR